MIISNYIIWIIHAPKTRATTPHILIARWSQEPNQFRSLLKISWLKNRVNAPEIKRTPAMIWTSSGSFDESAANQREAAIRILMPTAKYRPRGDWNFFVHAINLAGRMRAVSPGRTTKTVITMMAINKMVCLLGITSYNMVLDNIKFVIINPKIIIGDEKSMDILSNHLTN